MINNGDGGVKTRLNSEYKEFRSLALPTWKVEGRVHALSSLERLNELIKIDRSISTSVQLLHDRLQYYSCACLT